MLPLYMVPMEDWLLIAMLAVMLLGVFAQSAVQRQFSRYSKVPARSGLTAHDVAARLLRENNSAVQITPVQGSLTDHFNPRTNVVGLSQSVYNESSIAAVAVAAHEIGHVMQYQEDYAPIKLRNAILPVANIGSQAAPFIVLLGYLLGEFNIAFVGVVLFTAMLLFQLLTLPVELNASSRALTMLTEGGYIAYEEAPQAKKVLRAAAFTYVVGVISTLVTLLRLVSLAGRSRRN